MATKRSYYEGGSGDLVKWFRGKIQKIEDGNAKIVVETARRGEELTKQHIRTRGISKPGRIESGDMLRDIRSRELVDSAGRVQAHFGWIYNQEYYYGLQEGGFKHVNSGRDIPGMYALVDAAEEVFEDMKEEIRRNVKDA